MDGRIVGRYIACDEIAVGGMATVHIGRLLGPAGFSRTVAMKRLHRQFAGDPDFVAMFLDEARIAARIRHPNVVSTIDVVSVDSELYLVMDYIQGESVAHLLRALAKKSEPIPPRIAASIACDMLAGLHAAHDATDDRGQPLGIVHRDVSPQNVLVGTDGVARVVDFGVAKAAGRMQTTREGQVKGKAAYMAPEQLRGGAVDRRTDVYAASVVLWEMLTGERLFRSDTPAGAMTQVLEKVVPPPSSFAPAVDAAIDAIVLRGMQRDPGARFASAREMAVALEGVAPRESAMKIGDWVREVAGPVLDERADRVARIEKLSAEGALGEASSASSRSAASARTEADAVVSLVGTTSESRNRPGRSRSRMAWTIGSVAVLGSVAAGAVALRGTHAVQADASSAVAPPPSVSAPVAPQSSASALVPSAFASAPAPSAPPTPSAAPPQRRPLPARPSKPARVGCNPPYTVDADGYHIPKPECL